MNTNTIELRTQAKDQARQARQAKDQAKAESRAQAKLEASSGTTLESTANMNPVVPESAVKAPVMELRICKNIIPLDRLQKAINDAQALAGNARKEAQELGLGRLAKDVSGGGTLIPAPAVIGDLLKLGHFGGLDKDEIADTRAKADFVKGLNMVVDGLALLRLARRY